MAGLTAAVPVPRDRAPASYVKVREVGASSRGRDAQDEDPPPGVGAIIPDPGEPRELLFVPVVMNARAVQTFAEGGGVIGSFGGLGDGGEMRMRSCASAGRPASTMRVTRRRTLGSESGLTRTSQVSFHGPTWGRGEDLPCDTGVAAIHLWETS